MDGNELVRKMLIAYCAGHDETEDGMQAMVRAAQVCIDEALGDVTDAEWELHHGYDYKCGEPSKADRIDTDRLLRDRRTRLLAPKIAESRVTIEPCPRDSWKVLLDGKFHFGGNGVAKCDAEIYRDGLILKLKEHQS
jgi:hypothetical protein